MGFQIVRKFLFALDDKDFLSILDGVNFYNRNVTIKRYYYNQIFGTIKRYVEIKTKSDHMKLAAIIKKLAIERLTRVTHASFVRYFASKLFHSKRDDIIEKIRRMASDLERQANKTKVSNLVEKPLQRLQTKIDKHAKVFKSIIQLYKKKNNVASLSVPDLRTKLPTKFDNLRYQYVKARNAFYVNTDQSDDDMFISYVILFLRWIITECKVQNQITLNDALSKFCKRIGIALDPYVLETLDPISLTDDTTEEPQIDEMSEDEHFNVAEQSVLDMALDSPIQNITPNGSDNDDDDQVGPYQPIL